MGIMKKLTPKQERFCQEYIIDLNATQAAIRASYSEPSARQIASDLLSNVDIQERLKEIQKDIQERTQITQDMVIKELAKIGFSDIKNYYHGGDSQKPISGLDDKISGAIKEVKITEFTTESGVVTTKEIKLYDKKAALDSLGKHLGIFEKDNRQRALFPEGTKVIFENMDTDEQPNP
jgi:phage terminase small subunit